MIKIVTGIPGSGKSYYSIKEIVEAIRQGRRVWAVMEIERSNAWADLTGLTISELEDKLRIEKDLSFFGKVGAGDLVVIDEAQRYIRSGMDSDKDVLLWFETHRHLGADVILITQDYQKLLRQVYILAEMVYVFRKMSWLGMKNRARVRVKSGVKEDDVIKAFWMVYDKKYFILYRSYVNTSQAKELSVNEFPIWKSWTFRAAVLGVVVLVYVLAGRDWISSTSSESIAENSSNRAVAGPVQSVEYGQGVGMGFGVKQAKTVLYEVVGILCDDEKCLFSLNDGRMFRGETLVGLTGGSYSKGDDGLYRVISDKVSYTMF